MTPTEVGNRFRAWGIVALLALLATVPGLTQAKTTGGDDGLTWQLKQELYAPAQKWVAKQKADLPSEEARRKRAVISRRPVKVDDSTYKTTVHVGTAEDTKQVTERYTLTLSKAGGGWEVTDSELADTYEGLYRANGTGCYTFDKFSMDREGMKLTASNGSVCETYFMGGVVNFGVHADDLSYAYEPPAHASLVHTGHDFYAMHRLLEKDHSNELDFKPEAFLFECDAQSCEELLTESFEGLDRPTSAEDRNAVRFDDEMPAHASWAKPLIEDERRSMKDNPFHGFRSPDDEGRRQWSVYVTRDVNDFSGVGLAFDSWGGWEVQFFVIPKRWDIPEQAVGAIYGYYTEETLKNSTPYELERRTSPQRRWFDVYSVNGRIDLATDDPELLTGDVEFGLDLKQEVRELPFYIISRSESTFSGNRPPALRVNTVQMNGEDLTWIRTGPVSGKVILPETMAAGTRVNLRMGFGTKSIKKYTHSYSYMSRQGWMPFVSFGDVIDEFELTIKSPSKYEVLGIGHKADEWQEGEFTVSRWKAESPVNFPTIIFGKYRSDKAKFDAFKADGETVIPVNVHVDDASFSQWQISPKSLRPIAEQAVNSINLYTQISGIEYPFGELNLVNDPLGFLYGQAPSSIIYLGSGVFQGEGKLVPYFNDAAGISRFKRSVTAHEVGHQWWGNTVANANQRNYWFVESLAEYFSAIYLEAAFGYKEYQTQVEEWRRNIVGTRFKQNVQNVDTLWAGEDGGSARQNAIYSKGPYAFHMLRETFRGPGAPGPEGADKLFFEFLKRFTMELAKKREIVTLDIQQAAEAGLGGMDENGQPYNVDLAWFFDQWIRGTGIPQYAFHYDVRPTEDGNFLVEGKVKQRIVVGMGGNLQEIEGQYYRGVVNITVKAKGGPYAQRIAVQGPETAFRLKVPAKPIEVAFNENGDLLSHDVLVNKDW